jgi:SAM-dependent methyltransferase
MSRHAEAEAIGQGHAAGPPQSPSVTFWNEVLVPKFVRFRHILVDGLSQHSALVFPALAVRRGDRVVDVGCGFGDAAIVLARLVGPDGSVIGIDCCEAFLAFGRRDAAAAGLANVAFVEGDAQIHTLPPASDFVFSRFGTLFFDSPVAALRNMRRCLRPGGIFTMIVWRRIEDNPWLAIPKEIVRRYLPVAREDAPNCGPGPFSMADADLVAAQLGAAGFSAVRFERIDAPLIVGRDPDDAVAFQLALGPAGEIYREAGDVAVRRRDEIEAALRAKLAGYLRPEGVVMDSSSWKVTAVNQA